MPANLTITERTITVTADAISKEYGDLDPTLTYSASPPLVAGDGFTGSLTRAPGETLGDYEIQRGTLELSSNYTMTYVPGNLMIRERRITVRADVKSKVYGDPDPALTYTFSPSLVDGDSFGGALIREPSAEIVGTYGILQGTLQLNRNYVIIYQIATLYITPRPITIAAKY